MKPFFNVRTSRVICRAIWECSACLWSSRQISGDAKSRNHFFSVLSFFFLFANIQQRKPVHVRRIPRQRLICKHSFKLCAYIFNRTL